MIDAGFDGGRRHHVYLSYAHADDRQRVERLVDRLRAAFQTATGQPLRIFVDRLNVGAGALWELRLRSAMGDSCVMLAMLSSAYFQSEECGKEYDYFVALEPAYREAATRDQGLIFGVKVADWDAPLSERQKRRRTDAQRRQYYDLAASGSSEADTVDGLAHDLAEVLRNFPRTALALKHETVFTKIGSDVNTFIDRLADASRVTIVGITHYHLAEYLEKALALKLRRGRSPFWTDIKVVFLHESMLHAVRDELGRELAHERDALAKRLYMAKQGSSAVQRFFLRSDHHNAWQLLQYEGMLPFVGTYFEQSAGEQLVQIAMSRPGFATKDYLFLEFSSLTAPIELNCYADTFAEIVRGGTRSEEIILTGDPVRNGPFRLQKAVPRRSAFRAGSHHGTIPIIMLLLVRQTDDAPPIPLLQLRTTENRVRELETLANVSCYVLNQDCPDLRLSGPEGIELDDAIVETAVHRELRAELGIAELHMGTLTRHAAVPLVQPDHPNLYALLYSQPLDDTSIDPVVRVAEYSFQEILDVRLRQVIVKIEHVIMLPESPARSRSIEILALNLLLHDRLPLAGELRRYAGATPAARTKFERRIAAEAQALRRTFPFENQQREIRGLPRLQYREFFGAFLQAYADVGVAGAAAVLGRIAGDAELTKARDELTSYYRSAARIAEDPAAHA